MAMVIFLEFEDLCFLFVPNFGTSRDLSIRTSHLVSTWTSMRPFSAAPRTWGAAVIGCCPRVPRAATVAGPFGWSQGESTSWWINIHKHPIINIPLFFPWFIGFQHVSTILLVVQDFFHPQHLSLMWHSSTVQWETAKSSRRQRRSCYQTKKNQSLPWISHTRLLEM